MREEGDGLLGLSMIVGPRGAKSRRFGRRRAEGEMSEELLHSGGVMGDGCQRDDW
jgi:hypothetical protein